MSEVMCPMVFFSESEIANSYHKIKWFDKYCLDSGWIDVAFPFPSKETIDTLIEGALERDKNYVLDKAFLRITQLRDVIECAELEIKAINDFFIEKGLACRLVLPVPDDEEEDDYE